MSIKFQNTYTQLGDSFFQRIEPSTVKQPGLIAFNKTLADELGIPELSQDAAEVFSGNLLFKGCDPIAMAYSGHQFGHFNPGLGDGRAILLGQVLDQKGRQQDIQLKGSGRTSYSRDGDGRSALGPVLREYLVSEAMHHLGIPTTRALAAVTTGEEVVRECLTPGGIVTRVSRSFIRVGTFQYFASRSDVISTMRLADYVIEHLYPDIQTSQQPYMDLFAVICDRQARLIALWMQYGFIHGVMNTDNMSVAGETIDYGPCAFMDYFSHEKVYSFIDRQGRYAYNNQPNIGLWNLSRLAETLLPLISDNEDAAIEQAHHVLKQYIKNCQQYWLDGMRAKTGLSTSQYDDKELIDELLDIMQAGQADFSLTFYYLSLLERNESDQDHKLLDLFQQHEPIKKWLLKWRERITTQTEGDEQRKKSMLAVNPVYIPRNHQVEAVIRAAEDHHEFAPFHELYEVLQQPYTLQQGKEGYMRPPELHEIVQNTFCGT